jgi:DNA repair exonuclease SbcCD nuclease subunit
VIYTGDLFEQAKPQAPELRQAVRILEKLKEANIPFILSQGNHDVSYSRARRYGGDILEFLADLDIGVKYVQDEVAFIEKENEDHSEKLALILAVNYYGKRTDRILNQLLEANKDVLNSFTGPKILMLHAFIQGMPGTTDVRLRTIAKGKFQYVGVGHLHEKWENPEYNIYCPGSTDHTSSSEWKQPERGFYDVRLFNRNNQWVPDIDYVTIPTRAKHEFKYQFKSLSVPEIREEAEAFLINNDIEGAILRFIFSGSYDGKEHPFINLEKFRHVPKKSLHTIIVSKFLEAEKEQAHVQVLTKREAYEDLLAREYESPKPYIDEYIALIEDSIKIIEGSNSIADQERLLENRYSRFAKRSLGKFSTEKITTEEG